jgi:hypothetical protein
MPTVMTVQWKHVLFDPAVFIANHTFRVARVLGGVGAFPTLPARPYTTFASDARLWSPSQGAEAGLAPPFYEHEGKRFNFSFWSIKKYKNGRFQDGLSATNNNVRVTAPDGDIRLEATAFYYWNFGDDLGGHAVYIDAFDEVAQEFLPDRFADVIPDDMQGSLSAAADNGMVETNALKGTLVIRARSPMGDDASRQYQFQFWTNEQDLHLTAPATVPTIDGRDLRVTGGSVISALARYSPLPPPALPHIVLGREGGYIIGSPGDNEFLFVPFGGSPQPVGPWDPRLLAAVLAAAQSLPGPAQVIGQLEELRKRVEALEKPR